MIHQVVVVMIRSSAERGTPRRKESGVEGVSLPIDAVVPQLLEQLRTASAVVLSAPTGAGKTTRVPLAVLEGLRPAGEILLLEPRRLAARAAARRMAYERGVRLGSEIGYHVRFDRLASRQTRICAVTPGILLRRLIDDPFLESVSILVFDEFHERGLESDLALGIVRLLQTTVRPDLKLIVMSATLEIQRIASYLGDCPIVVSEGRCHPVDIRYEPRRSEQPWPSATAEAVRRIAVETPGDVLVFLPGMAEIRQTQRELQAWADAAGIAVLPLHGDLPPEEQDAALLPGQRRKVVLSTNVAETSVTVEGITAVIDTGLARLLTFDAELGLDRLELMPISRASAQQRAGRAGRTQPGICVRLWSEDAHRARPESTEAEIRRIDLAGAVLQLAAWGESDLAHFPWLEAPSANAVEQATQLLQRLGAIESGRLTELGRALSRLPVHPRIGRLLWEGARLGVAPRAALAAALLSERDAWMRPLRGTTAGPTDRPATESDVLDRVEALEAFEQTGTVHSFLGELHRGKATSILRTRDALLRTLREEIGSESATGARSSDEALLRALVAAYPDRLARRREPNRPRGILVGGRGIRLADDSGVQHAELFLCVDAEAKPTEALVRLASAVRSDWLPQQLLRESIEVEFDDASECVRARKRLRFDDLLLSESLAPLPDAEIVGQLLAEAAIRQMPKVLPSAESSAGQWLVRLRCLRQWLPERSLPEFDHDQLAEVVRQLAVGLRSFEELRQADWRTALQSRLAVAERTLIDREAPERLTVPSGSRIALRYEVGRPPILAVRIQEVFGWKETPRIAAGRVKVLLHLLAPNFRPQQVTDDLASFWANTYPLVRKELRARYPKHAWPEDPTTAEPLRGPKRTRQE